MCFYRYRRWDCGKYTKVTKNILFIFSLVGSLKLIMTWCIHCSIITGCKEKYLTYRCGYADRDKVGKGHETIWQKDTKGKDIYVEGECPQGCVNYKAKKPNPNDDDLYWRVRIYKGTSGWKNFFYR